MYFPRVKELRLEHGLTQTEVAKSISRQPIYIPPF